MPVPNRRGPRGVHRGADRALGQRTGPASGPEERAGRACRRSGPGSAPEGHPRRRRRVSWGGRPGGASCWRLAPWLEPARWRRACATVAARPRHWPGRRHSPSRLAPAPGARARPAPTGRRCAAACPQTSCCAQARPLSAGPAALRPAFRLPPAGRGRLLPYARRRRPLPVLRPPVRHAGGGAFGRPQLCRLVGHVRTGRGRDQDELLPARPRGAQRHRRRRPAPDRLLPPAGRPLACGPGGLMPHRGGGRAHPRRRGRRCWAAPTASPATT